MYIYVYIYIYRQIDRQIDRQIQIYICIYIYIYASKTKRYINGFGETKYMSFLIKDEELLKAYNKMYDKVSN